MLPNSICKGKSMSDNNKEQMDVDQAMEIHLKEEILMNILSRLPVRSLVHFKCVSKFWKTLISDPYFKKKHLSHAKNDPNSQKLLVSQSSLYKDDMYTFCCPLSSVQLVEDVQKLDFPLNFKPLGCFLFCCCDGLFFLSVYDGLDEHLLLWNPSTRESTVLPHPERPCRYDCTYGFGYDATSDDYKILKIDGPNGYEMSYEIFTLKSGSWRNIDKNHNVIMFVPTHAIPVMDSFAFVHGAFHWLGITSFSGFTVVSFSVSNEVYGEVTLLEQMRDTSGIQHDRIAISVLGGMLCYHSSQYNCQQEEGTFKLWIMKEYGVEESWTQLFTIREPGLSSVIPKYRFGNGEVLLSCGYSWGYGLIFRTSRGKFGSWPQCDADIYQEGFTYTESLISPVLLT